MSSVVAFLLSLANNPVVQSVALMVLGWVLKVGKDAAVIALRSRGQRSVATAEREVNAAASTPDKADDAVASDHLAKAKAQQELLDALASAIAKQDPTVFVNAVVNGKDAIPPSLLAAVRGDKP